MSTAEAARRLYHAGDFAQAGITVRVLLRENKFDQAALLLADLQLARYNGTGAEVTLRRALEALVPEEQVPLRLAEALNLQGNHQAVLDELRPDRLGNPAGPAVRQAHREAAAAARASRLSPAPRR